MTSADATKAEVSTAVGVEGTRWFPRRTTAKPAPSAEEIVADKLAQFTQSRRKLARLMARRKGVAVPSGRELGVKRQGYNQARGEEKSQGSSEGNSL